ncbi:SCP2 sterol-binding domain-containing protein [Myxococcota bacterium]|nr:SCP2 sterol-binding domain-containing protein [Myxococcota bacterium]
MNLAVEHFYSHRVPDQWNRTLDAQTERAATDAPALRLLEGMQQVEATLEVRVEDNSTQQRYSLNIHQGRMRCDQTAQRSPFLVLVHDLGTFQTLERESGDSILGFLGALAGQSDEMKLTSNRLRQLSELNGRARLELTDGPRMSLEARLGLGILEAEAPHCTLRLPAAVYTALRQGAVAPQDAFMSGQIRVDGDMNLAIQLALAAVSAD